MIASENFAPLCGDAGAGSVLTNKYAEGYPGRRYYGGCENVDVIEQLASTGLKKLFGAEFANVQPHSGAQANAAVDGRIAVTRVTRSRPCTASWRPSHPRNEAELLRQAIQRRRLPRVRGGPPGGHGGGRAVGPRTPPEAILAGWSAYPRQLDFAAFRRIADEVGAYLMVDMAHFAGLVAAGLHPSPVPHAHVVTSTTHKTLGGPRGGIILTNDDALAKKINSSVFPGQQGGPLEHVIAAKAVSFKLAAEPEFAERQQRTLDGAKILAERLLPRIPARRGSAWCPAAPTFTWCWWTCATPNSTASRPKTACTESGITVNRNTVPFDPRPPMISSGVRIGTPALATRGFDLDAFAEVADIIADALRPDTDETGLDELRARVDTLAARFPLYPDLTESRPDDSPAPGRASARSSRFPVAQPGAENVLRRRHRRWWRARPGDRALPGQEPRHHQRRGAGEGWLAGGNMARNTTLIRSNYLWDESARIYEHSLKLWEGLEDDLDYPILFSQRGVLNLAHSLQDVRDSVRRVEANRLNGIDASGSGPTTSRSCARW